MSYCRFSTDDFQCDIYCYESDFGYQIYVAGLRYVFDEPLPPKVELTPDVDIQAWMAREQKVSAMMDKARIEGRHVPIGLPYDSRSFCVATAGEAAAKLQELKALGYNVPDGVVECLLDEAVENLSIESDLITNTRELCDLRTK